MYFGEPFILFFVFRSLFILLSSCGLMFVMCFQHKEFADFCECAMRNSVQQDLAFVVIEKKSNKIACVFLCEDFTKPMPGLFVGRFVCS